MDDLLTSSEVAEILGISPDTLRIWEQKEFLIPSSKTHGGHRRYDKTIIFNMKASKIMIENQEYISSVFSDIQPGYPRYMFETHTQNGFFQLISKDYPQALAHYITYDVKEGLDEETNKAKFEIDYKECFIFLPNGVIQFPFTFKENDVFEKSLKNITRTFLPYNSIELMEYSKCNGLILISRLREYKLRSSNHHGANQLRRLHDLLLSKIGGSK